MSSLKTIDPQRAADLMRQGAVLVDVREAHEHAAEHIPGARHFALSGIDPDHPIEAGDTVLIFHCKSGGRTNLHAGRLAAAAGRCEAYVLGGGIEAWRRAGLPTRAGAGAEKPARGTLKGRISALFR
jgi:rhodanese-related sulfurtransferase